MEKIVNGLKNIGSWFYERTAVWIIFAFFVLIGWGQFQKNEIAAEVKEDELNCKLECLPMSSEFFQSIDDSQCWCYNDVNTLIKPQ